MVSPLYGIGIGLQSLTGGLQSGLERADRLAQMERENAIRQQQIQAQAAQQRATGEYRQAMLGKQNAAAQMTGEFRKSQLTETSRHNKAMEGHAGKQAASAAERTANAKERNRLLGEKQKAELEFLQRNGGLKPDQVERLELLRAALGGKDQDRDIRRAQIRLQALQNAENAIIKRQPRNRRMTPEDMQAMQDIRVERGILMRLLGGDDNEQAPTPAQPTTPIITPGAPTQTQPGTDYDKILRDEGR